MKLIVACLLIVSPLFGFGAGYLPTQPGYDRYCATLAALEAGVGCAWYGAPCAGQANLDPTARHTIWYSRWNEAAWSVPIVVTDDAEDKCWNPVLFRHDDLLLLFYKVGPDPRHWVGYVKRSTDAGATWSTPQRLPDGILGPTRNPPLRLPDGRLLCGSSREVGEPLEATASASCWLEVALNMPHLTDWRLVGPIQKPDGEFGLIQPALFYDREGRLHMLARDRAARRGHQGWIWEAISADHGLTWSQLHATVLPNPDLPVDLYQLENGDLLLACNPVHQGRSPLVLHRSQDDGRSWQPLLTLESLDDACYTAMAQDSQGRLHLVYSIAAGAGQPRELKHRIISLP
jgi:predicted neuraminidase